MKLAQLLPNKDRSTYGLEDIKTMIASAVQIALTLAGTIAIIYIVIGAYQYFTAYGDEAKATKAKTTITWAVVGVIVIVLSKVIITEIWSFISAGGAPSFWF